MGLVAVVLKAFPLQLAYETTDETRGVDAFYTVHLVVIRDRTGKIS
jgi:hypothetical protein